MVEFSRNILIIFYLVIGCYARQHPFVKFPQGKVQGHYMKSYGGRVFSAFEGIPYAKPPVGDLRFAEPQPYGKWNGILMGNSTYSCLCYVAVMTISGIIGSENCLYVYVYVPLLKIKGNENLNVVVHIHGGGFMFGDPNFMSGPQYLMDHDVVYVSFNYRLGLLGFLSTEDNVVPGNNGLKDQALALKWIKENIQYFGGNPNSITLTGISAGAASVHLHYFSPLSKGLFHRGFSQSGTAVSSWTIIKNPLRRAQELANHLNCPTNSSTKMIECFRTVGGTELMTAEKKLFLYLGAVPFILFAPVIEKGDNSFLSDHPYKLLKEGKIYDVPWITSNMKDEGLFPTGMIVTSNKMPEVDKDWNDIIYYVLDLYGGTVKENDKLEVVRSIRKFYYNDEPLTNKNAYIMVKMFSDRLFYTPAETAIRLQSKVNKSPVYYYFCSYILADPVLPYFGLKRGAGHGDDASLYVKVMTSSPVLDPSDEDMMKLLTKLIVDYANSSKLTIRNVEWLPVTPEDKFINTLKLDSPNTVGMTKLEKIGSKDFWNSLPLKENEKLFPALL